MQGHFKKQPFECKRCGNVHMKPEEKEGDVNLAIHLIADGYENVYDTAYLLTADSDQAATAKLFKTRLAPKGLKLVSIAPPDRQHSREILSHAHGNRTVFKQTVEACLFDREISKDGKVMATRPDRYDPPAGWKRPEPKGRT